MSLLSTLSLTRHACPGERFSLNTIKLFVSILLDRLNLSPEFREVKIPETQLGAVHLCLPSFLVALSLSLLSLSLSLRLRLRLRIYSYSCPPCPCPH